MNDNIRIKNDGENIGVFTPYSPEFVSRAKDLNGRWNGTSWVFSARDEDLVRDLLWQVYGTDGTPVPTVDLRIHLNVRDHARELLLIGGRTVLRKIDRDRRPLLGDGCIVVSGELKSHGGSRNHPQITFSEGTVVEVRDVPATVAQRLVDENPNVYELVDSTSGDNTLTPEETALVGRLMALPPERLALVLEALNQE